MRRIEDDAYLSETSGVLLASRGLVQNLHVYDLHHDRCVHGRDSCYDYDDPYFLAWMYHAYLFVN